MSKIEETVPEILVDIATRTTYRKGKYFGKGGFAKCYEIINVANGQSYAGKIISKALMMKDNQKEKIAQEIEIHRSLKHRNVVGFYNFFEDKTNIYIVLELCRKRSMMELHKRRQTVTEIEARYYLKQILHGVAYLHENHIIHRDLKLGNLFLDEGLCVKIGDFGLATKIEFDNQRKRTLCGTPNYIAPEVLTKKGHSYEVDVWSIGCIMYTLLLGKPPFETNTLKDTYERIKKCEYKLSFEIADKARHMIMAMLQQDPKKRPSVKDLFNHDFIQKGFCPSSLPDSALSMTPRFRPSEMFDRKPLAEVNTGNFPMPLVPENNKDVNNGLSSRQTFDNKEYLLTIRRQLGTVLKANPKRIEKMLDEMTDPAVQPLIWVSKWVDYSDKYGFGYQLNDESVGVMFNDTTKVILHADGFNVNYLDLMEVESYMTTSSYPRELDKKIKLLTYFTRYMKDHLVKTGANQQAQTDTVSRIPHLFQWCRSSSGVLMQLTNGTLQVNFCDHTKIILCPVMSAITFIDTDKSFRTFKYETLCKMGIQNILYDKIKYTFEKLLSLLDN